MAEAALSDVTVIWEPQSKPQAAFIACPVFEVFFGGSRGSLKTDSTLGDWINHSSLYGEHAVGLMVRRTREELTETFERFRQVLTQLGFKFSGHVARSPNGSRLTFAYLDKDSDAERYQGWSLTRVYCEEVGNFPNEAPVRKLMATLRSAKGVPVGFRATGNPGGPGHQWVKARYIDPAPHGWTVQAYEYENPFTGKIVTRDRVFIPGKITDHNLLGDEYIAQLQMSGSEALVRAWLLGDWDAIEGAFFDCWNKEKHVIEPFDIPEHWFRYRAMDWGSARPFSVGWYAVASETWQHPRGLIPRGALIRYREWYGMAKDQPNVGLKMHAEEVARGIVSRETDGGITDGVLDPSAFAQDGGPSIAERMTTPKTKTHPGLFWRPADNKRVADRGRMGGWDQVRARLIGEDGRPMLYVFDQCQHLIRTLPAMQHDEKRLEDLDTEAEDHVVDEVRYACMARPYTRPKPGTPKPVWPYVGKGDGSNIVGNVPIMELIKRKERRLREGF